MQSETYYHIYNHANGSENLFRSQENYRYFLQQWSKYIEPIAETYCYCLMPNHFHVLVRVRSEDEVLQFFRLKQPALQGFGTLGGFSAIISRQFSHLFNSYTQAYNKMYSRKGSLFMSNFKQKEITTDDYLSKIIHYLHHNPVHHRFCKHYKDWPHSSYHALISNQHTRLQRRAVLEWFGGKEEFTKFHQQNIEYPEQIKLE
ncbi:hypothetical protein [Reichenbachiella ulvae]|uniref:Transposase IS200-like domain-containing protein n=1 Tax=Reichenbachiella ulvae TaxID=2980104 RepID=A0ABT3CRR1_9BACT|nr:hypothetical protein [Reichenbachiella ulvae]MCV9386367.1 hypothetical protein [Reichenbachiella ulvae]